jgi:hypothetical protein
VTTPESGAPQPTAPRTAADIVRPLREPAALVLLAANAVLLFLTIIDLLFGSYGTFADRAGVVYEAFIGLYAIVLPLLAVALVHLRPVTPRARLITIGAVVEYAVSLVFGALTYITAFANDMSQTNGPTLGALFENLVRRTVWAALFGLAAFVLVRIWQGLYAAPRAPKAPPGYYGTPMPQQAPPGYPGATYAPGYAQPGQQYPASTGWPQVPPPPAPTPPYGAPGQQPGVPQQQVPQQQVPPQQPYAPQPPVSGAPASGANPYAAPVQPPGGLRPGGQDPSGPTIVGQ